MKANTSNLKHFLVTFLVAITCLFGTSSCLTALLISASRDAKQQSTDDNQGPKPIPGSYYCSRVTPSGQRLYYNKVFGAIEDKTGRVINYNGLIGVEVTNPDDKVRSGSSMIGPDYLTGVVVVPEKIAVGRDSLPVLRIGEHAFCGCNSVSAIVLPKTLDRGVSSSAFDRMMGLQTIVLNSTNTRDPIRFKGYYSEVNISGKKKIVPVVHWVPESSVKYYRDWSNVKESFFALPKGFDVYKGGNIEKFLASKKEFTEMHLNIWRTWGIEEPPYPYDFAIKNQQGKLMCYKILDPDNKTVAFVNPWYDSGNYVTGNVIIPPTISFEGTTYTVTTIMKRGLQCEGASSYFIPSTVNSIDNYMSGAFYKSVAGEGVRLVVCYATTPPQLPEPYENLSFGVQYSTLGCVVQVPKGCLDKYKSANTWNQQPELIMEVGDDFQQYLDGGRIDEYMEKAKNTINIDQMLAAQANFDKNKIEQRKKEEQAQKEKREKEWQAQQKKEIDQLKKQYGANYVNAMQKGDLTIGMPKGLVEYGTRNKLFKKFTSMDLDSQTATREVYDLYYTSLQTMLTYKVGWITFTNGKVSSIHWK